MARSVEDIEEELRLNPRNVRFAEVVKVASHHFGSPRTRGSHHIFRTPWPMDPRVNLQQGGDGKAKVYQVRQLIVAIEKLRVWGMK